MIKWACNTRIRGLVGWGSLAALVLMLFGCSFLETLRQHPWLSALKGMILAGLALGVLRQRPGADLAPVGRSALGDFMAVLAGALATFVINIETGLGAVVASGMVGLFGAVVLRPWAAALFCGSFVGMASPAVFVSLPCIILAGALAGVLYVAAAGIFEGFGGKLGTIAFGGCLAAAWILRFPLQSFTPPGWDIGRVIVLYSVLGAVATYMLNIRGRCGPVAASALVGLAAGLLLPMLHGPSTGEMLAVMAFCASFAGMSSQVRLVNELPVVLAGLFCGLVFIYSSPYLGGAGGKLGAIAFGSVIAVCGLADLTRGLRRRDG